MGQISFRWNVALLGLAVVLHVGTSVMRRSNVTFSAVYWIDYILLALIPIDLVARARHEGPVAFFKRDIVAIVSGILTIAYFFVAEKIYSHGSMVVSNGYYSVVILRSVVIYFVSTARNTRARKYFERLLMRPAHTTAISFMLVIFFGALLLNMPFSSRGNAPGLTIINSLFLATSAVCVTGLSSIDIAKDLSLAGQLILLTLIQIGGLGIMLLSHVFIAGVRKTLSVESKALLSYMLSEDNVRALTRLARSIVLVTFSIEAIGAGALLAGMALHDKLSLTAVYEAIFSAISAFCNAGFALRSDNFIHYRGSLPINITIMVLVLLGGVGFPVIFNVAKSFRYRIGILVGHRRKSMPLSLNTQVVLKGTFFLIFFGAFWFYALEHGDVLRNLPLKEQYLASFFQSVALRTAGFNTLDTSRLRLPTYLLMMGWMFIGGASGGTAGGVKINTMAVMKAGFTGFIRKSMKATIGSFYIAQDDVKRAFMLVLIGGASIFAATTLLTIVEPFTFAQVSFEAVSAFSTTGLTMGITPFLSIAGKIIIMILMYAGRIGPLTFFVLAQERSRGGEPSYPSGQLMVG